MLGRTSSLVLGAILSLASLLPAQRYAFTALGQSDGLDNLNLNAIVQDHAGFIWVGTENGVYRLAGLRFERVGQGEGLLNAFIYSLHVDAAGRLWAGTDDGLFVANDDHGQVGPFSAVTSNGKRFPVNPDAAFADLPGGRLLVVAGDTLMEVTQAAAGWSAEPYFKRHQELVGSAPQPIRAVLTDHNGAIWLGCGNGLCRISDDRVSVWGMAQGLPPGQWMELMQASNGSLWARSANDIAELRPDASRFELRDAGLPVSRANDGYFQMVEDGGGRILTAIGKGLARWNGSRWELLAAAQGLPPFPATALDYDRQGRLWLGLGGHGLYRWLGYGTWESWTPDNGLASPTIWSVLQASRTQAFVASELGVDRIDLATGQAQPFSELGADGRAAVRFIRQSSDGHVWFINRNGAVMEWDMAARRLTRYPRLRVHPFDVFADRDNRVWIASSDGLYVIEPPAGDGTRHMERVRDPAFDSNFFYTIAASPNGVLWAAAQTGLFRLDEDHWQKISLGAIPIDPRFELIVPGDDGSIWVSDYVTAIDRLWVEGNRVVRREAINPPVVASQQVVAMGRDARGWVWVGTDHGADVFDGHAWRRVTSDDGLLWNDVDDHAFSAAADGTVWIGTSAGVSHLIAPASVFAPLQLRTFITGMSFGTQPLAPGQSRLAWAKSALTIRFAALGSPNPSSLVYRYRLSGLEPDWTTTANGEARFSEPPPGHYTFEVVAEDTAQHVTAPAQRFSLTVTPPWWRSWWFQMLLFLAVVWLIFNGWRWRMQTLVARQRALESLVAERTRELEDEKRELEVARAALHVQATRDGLTQLWNRSAILDLLAAQLEHCARTEGRVGVVLLDLDHFKLINDRYGHRRGDEVLQEAARRFQDAVRESDYVGRYGGEEFLLVLPGLGERDGMELLERLRRAIFVTPFRVNGSRVTMTCSFGVAWVRGAARLEDVLERADGALYAAKELGRNRIETVNAWE